MEKLLAEILDELRFQSKVIEKQFNLLAASYDKKNEATKIPPEISDFILGMLPAVRGTSAEKTFENFANFLKKGKINGN
jgi:hypothetical protein